jgi:hypothetical protein
MDFFCILKNILKNSLVDIFMICLSYRLIKRYRKFTSAYLLCDKASLTIFRGWFVIFWCHRSADLMWSTHTVIIWLSKVTNLKWLGWLQPHLQSFEAKTPQKSIKLSNFRGRYNKRRLGVPCVAIKEENVKNIAFQSHTFRNQVLTFAHLKIVFQVNCNSQFAMPELLAPSIV